MKKIIIFRTGGIGDVILSTVALNVLQECSEDTDIIWVGREPSLELVQKYFPKIRVFNLDRSFNNFQLFLMLKKKLNGLDLIIDLQKSPRTILLSFLLKCVYLKTKYVTWNKLGFQRSLIVFSSRIVYWRKTIFRNRSSHFVQDIKLLKSRVDAMTECTIKGLNKIGIKTVKSKFTPRFNTQNEKENSFSICLGSLHALKEISMDKLRELTKMCIDNLSIKTIYLLGDINKHNDGEFLKSQFTNINSINLCGKTSLSEAANILSKCKFSIANDSALAHLSEAVNTPVVMFFGPTHTSFGYKPYLNNSLAFSSEIACRPCHKNGDTICRFGDELCKTQVQFEPVFKHLKMLNTYD